MGFNIFVQKLDFENPVYDLDLVHSIMLRDLPNPFDLTYADGSGAESFGIWDEENPKSFMFNRPGGRTFFERLFELAERTVSFIYWTAELPGYWLAITRPEQLALVPDFSGLKGGYAAIVRNGQELAEAMGFITSGSGWD